MIRRLRPHHGHGEQRRGEIGVHQVQIRARGRLREEPDVVERHHVVQPVEPDLGELARAETLLVEAKAIRDRASGPESPGAALILPALARLARERHDYAGAESLLQRALRTLTAAGYTDLQDDVQRVHRDLVALYEAWGRADRAAPHRRVLIGGLPRLRRLS